MRRALVPTLALVGAVTLAYLATGYGAGYAAHHAGVSASDAHAALALAAVVCGGVGFALGRLRGR